MASSVILFTILMEFRISSSIHSNLISEFYRYFFIGVILFSFGAILLCLSNLPWMEKYLQKLENYELLTETEVESICNEAMDILVLEPNVCKVEPPALVVGDIHGQFSDLVKIFEKNGNPDAINYVFLGDYVDRGENSLECILYLLIYKIKYPRGLTLLRGNHELKNINRVYGFYDEVWSRYGNNRVWNILNDVFSYFGIACIVDGRFLCVHGGISPRITMNKLERLDRFESVTSDSIINDVSWSDPYHKNGFSPNPRGSGFLFGEDVAKKFLTINNLELIIRSHQLAIEGYRWDFKDLCLTVWSAPNYMNKCYNPASICFIEKDTDVTTKSLRIHSKKPQGSSQQASINGKGSSLKL